MESNNFDLDVDILLPNTTFLTTSPTIPSQQSQPHDTTTLSSLTLTQLDRNEIHSHKSTINSKRNLVEDIYTISNPTQPPIINNKYAVVPSPYTKYVTTRSLHHYQSHPYEQHPNWSQLTINYYNEINIDSPLLTFNTIPPTIPNSHHLYDHQSLSIINKNSPYTHPHSTQFIPTPSFINQHHYQPELPLEQFNSEELEDYSSNWSQIYPFATLLFDVLIISHLILFIVVRQLFKKYGHRIEDSWLAPYAALLDMTDFFITLVAILLPIIFIIIRLGLLPWLFDPNSILGMMYGPKLQILIRRACCCRWTKSKHYPLHQFIDTITNINNNCIPLYQYNIIGIDLNGKEHSICFNLPIISHYNDISAPPEQVLHAIETKSKGLVRCRTKYKVKCSNESMINLLRVEQLIQQHYKLVYNFQSVKLDRTLLFIQTKISHDLFRRKNIHNGFTANNGQKAQKGQEDDKLIHNTLYNDLLPNSISSIELSDSSVNISIDYQQLDENSTNNTNNRKNNNINISTTTNHTSQLSPTKQYNSINRPTSSSSSSSSTSTSTTINNNTLHFNSTNDLNQFYLTEASLPHNIFPQFDLNEYDIIYTSKSQSKEKHYYDYVIVNDTKSHYWKWTQSSLVSIFSSPFCALIYIMIPFTLSCFTCCMNYMTNFTQFQYKHIKFVHFDFSAFLPYDFIDVISNIDQKNINITMSSKNTSFQTNEQSKLTTLSTRNSFNGTTINNTKNSIVTTPTTISNDIDSHFINITPSSPRTINRYNQLQTSYEMIPIADQLLLTNPYIHPIITNVLDFQHSHHKDDNEQQNEQLQSIDEELNGNSVVIIHNENSGGDNNNDMNGNNNDMNGNNNILTNNNNNNHSNNNIPLLTKLPTKPIEIDTESIYTSIPFDQTTFNQLSINYRSTQQHLHNNNDDTDGQQNQQQNELIDQNQQEVLSDKLMIKPIRDNKIKPFSVSSPNLFSPIPSTSTSPSPSLLSPLQSPYYNNSNMVQSPTSSSSSSSSSTFQRYYISNTFAAPNHEENITIVTQASSYPSTTIAIHYPTPQTLFIPKLNYFTSNEITNYAKFEYNASEILHPRCGPCRRPRLCDLTLFKMLFSYRTIISFLSLLATIFEIINWEGTKSTHLYIKIWNMIEPFIFPYLFYIFGQLPMNGFIPTLYQRLWAKSERSITDNYYHFLTLAADRGLFQTNWTQYNDIQTRIQLMNISEPTLTLKIECYHYEPTTTLVSTLPYVGLHNLWGKTVTHQEVVHIPILRDIKISPGYEYFITNIVKTRPDRFIGINYATEYRLHPYQQEILDKWITILKKYYARYDMYCDVTTQYTLIRSTNYNNHTNNIPTHKIQLPLTINQHNNNDNDDDYNNYDMNDNNDEMSIVYSNSNKINYGIDNDIQFQSNHNQFSPSILTLSTDNTTLINNNENDLTTIGTDINDLVFNDNHHMPNVNHISIPSGTTTIDQLQLSTSSTISNNNDGNNNNNSPRITSTLNSNIIHPYSNSRYQHHFIWDDLLVRKKYHYIDKPAFQQSSTTSSPNDNNNDILSPEQQNYYNNQSITMTSPLSNVISESYYQIDVDNTSHLTINGTGNTTNPTHNNSKSSIYDSNSSALNNSLNNSNYNNNNNNNTSTFNYFEVLDSIYQQQYTPGSPLQSNLIQPDIKATPEMNNNTQRRSTIKQILDKVVQLEHNDAIFTTDGRYRLWDTPNYDHWVLNNTFRPNGFCCCCDIFEKLICAIIIQCRIIFFMFIWIYLMMIPYIFWILQHIIVKYVDIRYIHIGKPIHPVIDFYYQQLSLSPTTTIQSITKQHHNYIQPNNTNKNILSLVVGKVKKTLHKVKKNVFLSSKQNKYMSVNSENDALLDFNNNNNNTNNNAANNMNSNGTQQLITSPTTLETPLLNENNIHTDYSNNYDMFE